MFDWKSVFVLYWKDIIDIFRYYKHNTPSNDFSLDNFLIYDIKNIDSYSSIEDFLANIFSVCTLTICIKFSFKMLNGSFKNVSNVLNIFIAILTSISVKIIV